LTEGGDETRSGHYFDVERFRKVHADTSKRRGRLGRILNRIFWALHSVESLLTSVLFPMVMIPGMLLTVVLVLYYGGGLALYAVIATFFILVGVFGERRLSSSRFTESGDFWKKLIFQVVAYSAIVGVFLVMLLVWK
jgi:ABC-type transport system involved in cytochrome bd biosynthesis fused ATPase/permease subunit